MQSRSTVNKVILAGRVESEPLCRVENGESIIIFGLSTEENITKKGQIEIIEERHRIKVKADLIDVDIIKKNAPFYIQGSLHTVQIVDENDVKQRETFVIANAIEVLNIRS